MSDQKVPGGNTHIVATASAVEPLKAGTIYFMVGDRKPPVMALSEDGKLCFWGESLKGDYAHLHRAILKIFATFYQYRSEDLKKGLEIASGNGTPPGQINFFVRKNTLEEERVFTVLSDGYFEDSNGLKTKNPYQALCLIQDWIIRVGQLVVRS